MVEASEVAGSKQQAQYSILFKLQTNKAFNKEAFKATCGDLWHFNQSVTIREVGQNLFIAVFGSEDQSMTVLDKSPWSFDKKLILMKRFLDDSSPAIVTFSHSPSWIHIFNIPIKSMNNAVGTRIGNEMGELIMVDAPKSGLAWGFFLRVRVNIDITKPLIRGKMIQIDDLEVSWVTFKYEWLPIFSYRCGILGHQDRECPQLKKGCFSVDEDGFQFGPWLCSLAPKGNRKKDTRNSFLDMQDDEEDDVQSFLCGG